MYGSTVATTLYMYIHIYFCMHMHTHFSMHIHFTLSNTKSSFHDGLSVWREKQHTCHVHIILYMCTYNENTGHMTWVYTRTVLYMQILGTKSHDRTYMYVHNLGHHIMPQMYTCTLYILQEIQCKYKTYVPSFSFWSEMLPHVLSLFSDWALHMDHWRNTQEEDGIELDVQITGTHSVQDMTHVHSNVHVTLLYLVRHRYMYM